MPIYDEALDRIRRAVATGPQGPWCARTALQDWYRAYGAPESLTADLMAIDRAYRAALAEAIPIQGGGDR